MKKFFTFFAAALMSVSMFGKTVTEDISMDPANWGWGYGSSVVADGDMLKCTLTSEWGAMATGWNEPTRDLSEWDKLVVVVENMNGCDGEWFKLKAYLRDYVNKDSEQGQMEATLGLDAEDRQQNYMVINLKEEGKNVNLTACGVLGIQCQPNGAEFKISRVYLEKEVEDVTYTLQLVADPEKGSVAVTNLLGSDIIDNGNGNYTVPENAEVTILATPLEGYQFSGWKVGNRYCDFTECGTAINTNDNPMTITMTADVAYKAEFAAVTPVEMTTIYDWAGEIGTTILGTNGVEISTVKIHENTDAISGIKFGSSYVYADGKWVAIKPAEGGFKAGDVLSVSVVFNNSDVTKYCMVDLRAADGDTRIWMSDSVSTLNGRNAGEPIVQTYTLEADQDSLFLGRYGNTGMFVTLLKVERAAGGDTPGTYTLQLVADPTKGSVAVTNLLGSDIIDNGNGNYTVPANAEVTILATPLEGYKFTGWKEGNIEEMVGCYYCGTAINTNDNPMTFTMTADVAYLAEFEEAQGIENVVLSEKAQKIVVDGMLYIVRDGKMFNVQGAQIR